MPDPRLDTAISDTRRWLERAVIGLNLCPFAKAVSVKGLIHLAASQADDMRGAIRDLEGELDALVALPVEERETTLLVTPLALQDFLDFNEAIAQGERLIRKRKLEGVVQLASFHPHYRFAGTDEDDITNCTNRSPWPILHLLREESVDRAVESFPEPDTIYDANMARLRLLGAQGWADLGVGPSA